VVFPGPTQPELAGAKVMSCFTIEAATPEIIKRFWKKVSKQRKCWIWTGGRNRQGYGIFHFIDRDVKAHRFSYALHKSDIPDGMDVLHDCPEKDNPSCVNPAHLYIGTDIENGRDRAEKKQMRPPCGEDHYKAKITNFERDQIIPALRKRGWTLQRIGACFGISKSHTGKLLKRKQT
jgi:hypothetical protein